ncbi:MAG: hypothetical protein Dasosvirus2_17 [Dasosvirus sp.]|uniref:Uncharacterized protein n=1 Tax=Dasosvirus sp. TaxID=2487764 RepID=A0A3G4ZTU2_9VIRU|nr:MAG: hypothetical protein Dasosvirus2_17 [Dasosvirus sp.]
MDNIIMIDKEEYYLEKVWRTSRKDYQRDSKGKLFPLPKVPKSKDSKDPIDNWTVKPQNFWFGWETFIERLEIINDYLNNKKNYSDYAHPFACYICGKKNVSSRRYYLKNVMWEDSLVHYISLHGIEPNEAFKDFIYQQKIGIMASRSKKISLLSNKKKSKGYILQAEKVRRNDKNYVKLDKNQLLILDALMIHGGFQKKYQKDNINIYSEHAGIIDFEYGVVNKIIVAANTTRVESDDGEIYLPVDTDDIAQYEYIFHTHPPTPKEGGRATDGILYEFPSIGDLFHFIEFHNDKDSHIIGSLVVTAEGMYNIRKLSNNYEKIDIDDDKLFREYDRKFYKIQREAIDKYGTRFGKKEFYSVIAQDTSFIDQYNKFLNKYNIHIDFYPRKKDKNNNWYIDTIYLVFRDSKK